MNGQITIFDFIDQGKHYTLNDYWESRIKHKPIQMSREDLISEQEKLGDHCYWYFYVTKNKCCGCYPMLQHTHSHFIPYEYLECLICGRKTKQIDDYSWTGTKRQWDQMMEELEAK